jgi:hypothetical protein
LFAFPPISGTNNSDFIVPISESNSHNSIRYSAETIKPFFLITVFKILQNDTIVIKKSELCQCKGYSMLFLVNQIFRLVPFKISSLFHVYMFCPKWFFVNIFIWLYVIAMPYSG